MDTFDLTKFTPYLSSLQEVINRKQHTEADMLWQLFSQFTYERAKYPEILQLYKALDLNTFAKVISILGGKEVRFPTKAEIEDNLLAALFYMDREIYGLSWDEIKAKYPQLSISALKYTVRIKSLNAYMQQQIQQVINPSPPVVEDVYVESLFEEGDV